MDRKVKEIVADDVIYSFKPTVVKLKVTPWELTRALLKLTPVTSWYFENIKKFNCTDANVKNTVNAFHRFTISNILIEREMQYDKR